MHIIVTEAKPLLEILATLSPESSKTTLRSWMKDGRITVDEQVVRQGNVVIEKGKKVALGVKVHSMPGGIKIVYEDKHFVAIEKPSGLLSVSTAFEKGDTAHGFLKKHFHPRKVSVVHRLDQDTSGVMLFALSEEGYDGLKKLFEVHSIERSYCAIIEGKLNPPEGTWQSNLYEDSQYVVHSTEDQTFGRIAITHYSTKKSNARYSCLDLKLETGRKNQIRVHCNDHGHPVVGDKKYGSLVDPIHRLCLHAQLIAFEHPVTKKEMRFISPLPASFERLIGK